ncbi:hypothetical protein CLAIMM_09556 [Cladophialophora immunda]|nr:hypothetical protein CLAIMM_09556 [Cladophialophora immunda]
MSSEQRYDGSYTRLLQDDLPELDLFDLPNLNLFGDSTMTPVIANTFDDLLGSGQADAQHGGQLFHDLGAAEQSQQLNMTWNGASNFNPDAFATSQPSDSSAFAPLDTAVAFQTAGQSVFDVGNFSRLQDGYQTFENTAGHSHLGGLEAAQTSLLGASLITANNESLGTPLHTHELNQSTHEIALPEAAIPIRAAFCHCTSCRRMSGALCVTSFPVPVPSEEEECHYRPPATLLEKLTPFEFSKGRITHFFCAACGTHMVARVLPRERRDGSVARWFVMCGTLESAGAGDADADVQGVYRPRHEYLADTLDGGVADMLPSCAQSGRIERWAGHPGEGEQLALHWVSPGRPPSSTPSLADRLHAHCKCGGVEFWIARPADGGSKYVATLCACDHDSSPSPTPPPAAAAV